MDIRPFTESQSSRVLLTRSTRWQILTDWNRRMNLHLADTGLTHLRVSWARGLACRIMIYSGDLGRAAAA